MDLKKLGIDELLETIETAAIKANDAFESGAPVELQHEWVDIQSAAIDELKDRGDDAMRRFIPLLESPHPVVRLIAALNTRKLEPTLATPVLEGLQDGKYGLLVAMDAQTTIKAMRKRGELLPLPEA